MLTSLLWIEGPDFDAQSAARHLDLDDIFYALKGEPFEFGRRKGEPRPNAVLQVPLSERLDHDRHMKQVEKRLRKLKKFLKAERRLHGDAVAFFLSVGMTVGGEKYFTRTYSPTPGLMKLLVDLGVELSVSAYPCSDRTKRKHLKWSDGVGLTPKSRK